MAAYTHVKAVLHRIYVYGVDHPRPWVRTSCLTLVMAALSVRAARVWPRTAVISAAAAGLGAAAAAGPIAGAALLIGGGLLCLAAAIAAHPSDGVGHRVGTRGVADAPAENTVEALEVLAQADAAGAFDAQHFPYIEFDVQETADGELVLFHDLAIAAAFPEGGANAEAWAALRAAGVRSSVATVQDLTAAQLGSLHLGGRRGVHVPTLQQFLEACKACGVRRTLALEVKALRSDAARQKLLDLMSGYLATHGRALDADPAAVSLQYKPLGWAGIIAFPHYFAESFGEYGSPQWRRWAGEMRRRGIPARCVHLHQLELTYGADA